MTYLSLDQITRSVLLKQGKSLHWYIQYLSYAIGGLKKLHIHSLKNIKSVKLAVNSYKAVTLPEDFVDYVRVGYAVGERVRPILLDKTLNRLNNFDTDGTTKIPYEAAELDDSILDYLLDQQQAIYNHPADRDDYLFNIFRERNEIQLSINFTGDYIILDYISEGIDVDSATQINPLAQEAIEKYILWQERVHSRTASEGERGAAKMRFDEEHRLLRAALSDLTTDDIIHAIKSGYSGTY